MEIPKFLRASLAVACIGLATGCAVRAPERTDQAAIVPVAPGIVSVTYDNPATFDQGRTGGRETEKARRAWVDALSQYLAESAAPWLSRGQRLEVHITDVQRAGNFEPWRGPQGADVRIVRDVYPPRIDLRFRLLDGDARLLREGVRQLRDATFMMRPDRHPNDPLRYEKALLDDWLQQELRR